MSVRVYDLLIYGVEQLNSFYGVTILCSIGSQFVSGISRLFYFTIDANDFILGESITIGTTFLAASAFSSAYIYSLAKTCDLVVKKAEQFSKLLATRALNDKTGQFLANPHVAMHFASRKKVEFNVCGCFNLDLRLGCSMLAACVTYLVILVQINDQKK
ncbi:7tm Chemosensory receptor [Nesidiocoris tenuis]|uniref:7tm Chemosensory receptor n=1 Tax=Nesidiocoris tenuis TaxID=355587 RepID=A0ABN7AIR1_9HEMI|nr:7tm Chemosensory receptor [Nesidiocoris tenuis]